MDSKINLGTENVRWDLSVFYNGVSDPQLGNDLAALIALQKSFNEQYKGRLDQKLGNAIADYEQIVILQSKIGDYLYLVQSLDTSDAAVNAKMAEVDQLTSKQWAEQMTFFMLELVTLDDTAIDGLYKTDPALEKYRPWITYNRIFKPHYLSEAVESALTKRGPFGPTAWSELFDELEANLRFPFDGADKSFSEISHVMTSSKDADERSRALNVMNETFKGLFAKYSAQNLYMVAGANAVEQEERDYRHPMDKRNKTNRVPDAVVEALHHAVTHVAGPITKKYYALKAKHLGLEKLAWSDRNAPMPFADEQSIAFPTALAMVTEAYTNFSSTLGGMVKEMAAANRLDAAAGPKRRGGGYCASLVLPGNIPASFIFMTYLGSQRDIKTLAHEFGHAVHSILAGQIHGPLMFHPPTAYAETASTFGEMLTFDFLKEQYRKNGDRPALLKLFFSTIDDVINTTVRQTAFSNFERRLHGMDASYTTWDKCKKLSPEELSAIWQQTTQELYGAEGEVFTYKDSEMFWSCIPHFHTAFYVYGYAFGQLLTQSIYAQKERLGEKFEPLYLDLLRAGSTKDAVELLKPFDLDPTHEQFWADGITNGLGRMVAELEALVTEMGL